MFLEPIKIENCCEMERSHETRTTILACVMSDSHKVMMRAEQKRKKRRAREHASRRHRRQLHVILERHHHTESKHSATSWCDNTISASNSQARNACCDNSVVRTRASVQVTGALLHAIHRTEFKGRPLDFVGYGLQICKEEGKG